MFCDGPAAAGLAKRENGLISLICLMERRGGAEGGAEGGEIAMYVSIYQARSVPRVVVEAFASAAARRALRYAESVHMYEEWSVDVWRYARDQKATRGTSEQ